MNGLFNAMRLQAQLANQSRAAVRIGTISSYNPANYAAKVLLQPEGTETGWLPIASFQVGNGWGIFSPPSIGDMVEVQFQEDSSEAGLICGRFFNDTDRPLSVPSGEFWLVNQSGSKLKFHNDGTVELIAIGAITSSAPQWTHTGNFKVVGDIVATVDIWDYNKTKGTLQHIRDNYDAHTHTDPQGGSTGGPSNTL